MWKLFFQTTGHGGHGWRNTAAVSSPVCRNKHIIAKTKMAVIRMELQKSREIRCDPTGFFLCLQGDAHLIRKRQIFPRLADGL